MNTKQLSECCKAEIKLTGKDRPNAFACKKCGRIIGTPMPNTKQPEQNKTIKFKVGDNVSINGKGSFKVLEIIKHGFGFCNCCLTEPYPMYRISDGMSVSEDQLKLLILN